MGTMELIFIGLNAFALLVAIFAFVIVMCMGTKLGFVNKTWAIYDDYKAFKQRQQLENAVINNFALEEM